MSVDTLRYCEKLVYHHKELHLTELDTLRRGLALLINLSLPAKTVAPLSIELERVSEYREPNPRNHLDQMLFDRLMQVSIGL